jgi:hypothetical protein
MGKKNPLLRVGKIAMKKKVMLDITIVKVILNIKLTKIKTKKVTFFCKNNKDNVL